MSSISESTSRDIKSTSTTTVPDYSSLSSSSSNRSLINDLRQRLELLKTQLHQKEKELTDVRWEKEEETATQNMVKAEFRQLQQKSSALSGMCNDLLAFIRQNEDEETGRLRELEHFYRENIKTLSETSTGLRAENGQLRQKLSVCEGKVTSVIHENNFLRWDAETRDKELEELKKKFEDSCREVSALRAESSSLSSELRQLKRMHLETVDTEIQRAARTTATKIEKVKRVHDDREKEYGLTLTRMQNEIDFLRSEVERKTNQADRLTEMMDKLTLDNKKLFEFHGQVSKVADEERLEWQEVVKGLEEELERVRGQKEDLKMSLQIAREGEKENACQADSVEHRLAERQQQLETARTTAQVLKKQLAEVTAVHEMSQPELRHELKVKTARLIELEKELEEKKKECEQEREQRLGSAVVLVEMTKDMKMMIEAMKN